MTTTAQTALKEFEESWVTLQWVSMTDAARNTYLRNYLGLQIAASKETEENRIEAEMQAETDAAQRKQQAVEYLTAQGFACNNSAADWHKLYSRPEIFGANWQETADYQQSISTGVDYFIQMAQSLL